jgi:hypothetical protein
MQRSVLDAPRGPLYDAARDDPRPRHANAPTVRDVLRLRGGSAPSAAGRSVARRHRVGHAAVFDGESYCRRLTGSRTGRLPTFSAGAIVSEARHLLGAPRFTPAAGAEPDVLDLVATLRAKGIRLEPVATGPYRRPAKAAYLCAEVPPLDTFARLMRNGEGLGDRQGIVFVGLHNNPSTPRLRLSVLTTSGVTRN